MKQSPDKLQLTTARVRARRTILILGTTIFFLLAMVVPLSIKTLSTAAQTFPSNDLPVESPESSSDAPSPLPESVLPDFDVDGDDDDDDGSPNSREETRIDVDDEISNSQDKRMYTYLRPSSLPPSSVPSGKPSSSPSAQPSNTPTHHPFQTPSEQPSDVPHLLSVAGSLRLASSQYFCSWLANAHGAWITTLSGTHGTPTSEKRPESRAQGWRSVWSRLSFDARFRGNL